MRRSSKSTLIAASGWLLIGFFLALLPGFAVLAQATAPAQPATEATTRPLRQSYGAIYAHGFGEQLYVSFYLPPDRLVGSNFVDEGLSGIYSRGPDGKYSLVTSIAGRVVGFTSHRGDKIAFTEIGSWRVIFPGGSSTGDQLPGGARLRNLAGVGDELFAVGRLHGTTRLYQYDSTLTPKWKDLGPLPAMTIDTAADVPVALGAVGKTLYIARADGATGVEYLTVDQGVVSLVGKAEVGFVVSEAEVLDLGGTLVVWASPGDAHGGVLLWDLPSDGQRMQRLGSKAGEVAVAGSRLRFIYGDEKTKESFEAIYDLQGNAVGKPLVFEVPLRGGAQQLVQLLQVAVLMGLALAITVSFIRSSETRQATEAYLQGRLRVNVAPLMKRAGAAVIDSLPLVAALVYVGSIGNSATGDDWIMDPVPVLMVMAAALVCVTHMGIGELVSGKSIGKAIFGLRVATLTGTKPSVGAILVRNLLRLTDYLLILTVVLSPLRQRMGDSVAGTIVVDEAPPEEEEPEF